MPLKRGQAVRLQHGATRKWLHSHQFYAPISGNQEVSAYGSDTSSDGGDVWTVEWDSKAKHWKQDAKVRDVLSSGVVVVLAQSADLLQPVRGSCTGSQAQQISCHHTTPPPSNKQTHQTKQIRLRHRDTSVLLSSSKDTQFGQPIHGQQEVCGVGSKTKDTEWFAAEGIYLPRSDGHGGKKAAAAAGGSASGGEAAQDGKKEL